MKADLEKIFSANDPHPKSGASPVSSTPTPSAPEKKSGAPWLTIVIVVVVLAVVAGVVVLASGVLQKKATQVSDPTPVMTVTVAPAELRTIHQEIKVTGSVWAWDPLEIGAEVSGLKIENVLVEEGDRVTKGQPLVYLNSSVLRAELEREQAILRSNKAAWNKALQPNRREEIHGLRAAVAQAQASVEQSRAQLVQAQANVVEAQHNAERYAALQKEGAVSVQESENRSTLTKVSEAEVRNAQQRVHASEFALKQMQERLHMAESGGRTEDIDMASAEVARTNANIKRLEALIAQTVIKAPCNGLILKRNAHIGDTSSVNESLFEMVRDNRLELRAQVPERDIIRLKPGMHVTVTSSGSSLPSVSATLREVSPKVDPESRLGMARIDLPNTDTLKPGMFAEGHVFLQDFKALTVPAQSIVTKDNRNLLFTVENNKTVMKEVMLGARNGDYVEILAGLKPAEPVITAGAGFLKDGDLVTVRDGQGNSSKKP